MTYGSLDTQITGRKAEAAVSHRGLHVDWFNAWHPALEEALPSLPEVESCPHELYRLLLECHGAAPKSIALVTERGVPVAVIGLRHISRHSWEILTQWIIPGFLFPALPQYHLPALEVLGIDVWVAWWRMKTAPPCSDLIRSITPSPTYRLSLAGNYEQYWHETGFFKTIRNIRNRCRELTLEVNAPGAANWTIRNWDAKWHTRGAEMTSAERSVAAEYLEKRGLYFTLTLSEQGVWVGGATMAVHDRDLVAGVIYRDSRYDYYGIGDRLIDLGFAFGAERGFCVFDLGGGHDYKRRWARQEGEHWLVDLCPEPLFMAKQAVHWMHSVGNTVAGMTRPHS